MLNLIPNILTPMQKLFKYITILTVNGTFALFKANAATYCIFISAMPSVCNAIMVVCLLDKQLPLPSVPITTNVVNSIPAEGEMYSLQQYKIHFVSDLWQVDGFLMVLRFPPPIKQTTVI